MHIYGFKIKENNNLKLKNNKIIFYQKLLKRKYILIKNKIKNKNKNKN
jgi:hypothetical protein